MFRYFVTALLLNLSLLAAPAIAVAQDLSGLSNTFDARRLTYDDKRFLQTALAFSGEYQGLLDGDWGNLSQSAFERYAWRKFNEHAQDIHMVSLAFDYVKLQETDGWQMQYIEQIGMSMILPQDALATDGASNGLSNAHHANSSLAFSFGRQNLAKTRQLHDYTLSQHAVAEPPYTIRISNFAVTRAVRRDGFVLYARSNFINGAWSTIILSAKAPDVSLLNAVASSLSMGHASPIVFSNGGQIDLAVRQVIAYLKAEDERARQASATRRTPAPQQPSRPSGSSGSGFVVSASGHILTNAHVVEGCRNLLVDGAKAELLATSSTFDLALLQTDAPKNRNVARFAADSARLNSDVTAIGFPYAGVLGGLNVTRGSVSSLKGLFGDEMQFQITAPVQAGNSGGPLLAQDGGVVGVVVSKLDARAAEEITGDLPQNINFAIRGEIAKLFLSQNGVTAAVANDAAPMGAEDLADLATGFTTFIQCN